MTKRPWDPPSPTALEFTAGETLPLVSVDYEPAAREQLRMSGYEVPDRLKANTHTPGGRLRDPNDKGIQRAGYYYFHTEPFVLLVWGTWKDWPHTHVWTPAGATSFATLSPGEQRAFEEAAAQRQRDHRLFVAHAIETLRERFQSYGAANPHHGYIQAKGIEPVGLRQDGNRLIVPLITLDGHLMSVQRIAPDGTKRFEKGLPVQGLFFQLGHLDPNAPPERLYFVEGYATAVSVWLARNRNALVIACMSAGNLAPVLNAWRLRFRTTAFLVCGEPGAAGPDTDAPLHAHAQVFVDGDPYSALVVPHLAP
ncbi:MAG: hypothetical protein ACR2RB_22400 [Gammaproteobacteria bacterium]